MIVVLAEHHVELMQLGLEVHNLLGCWKQLLTNCARHGADLLVEIIDLIVHLPESAAFITELISAGGLLVSPSFLLLDEPLELLYSAKWIA